MNKIGKNRQILCRGLVIVLLLTGLPGCAVILGGADDAASGAPDSAVRIRYVETLRNPASLVNDRYAQQGVSSLPTSSLLQQPTSVAADAFRVYVTDQAPLPQLAVFDRAARSLTIYSSPTPTVSGERFLDPSSVAVADSGEIFIADPRQGKVFGLDRGGRLMFTIGKSGGLVFPVAVAVDSQKRRLYIADKHAHALRVYWTSGEWIQDITSGDSNRRLTAPAGLAIDGKGTCYVLDVHENRIHVLGSAGQWQRSFPIETDRPGEIVKPHGIAVDSDGHVYVIDSIGNSILLFDRNGVYLQRWGRTGDQFDGFWHPSAIFIDSRDTIYVADRMNGRIQVFQYEK